MDFLGQVSVRYVNEVEESDEENDAGGRFRSAFLPFMKCLPSIDMLSYVSAQFQRLKFKPH